MSYATGTSRLFWLSRSDDMESLKRLARREAVRAILSLPIKAAILSVPKARKPLDKAATFLVRRLRPR